LSGDERAVLPRPPQKSSPPQAGEGGMREGGRQRGVGKDQESKKTSEGEAGSHSTTVQKNPGPLQAPSAKGEPFGASWREILQQIKEKKPNLGSYLEHGVLVKMEKEGVHVGYPESSAFLIPLVCKEEHLKLIGELLAAYYGQMVPFRTVTLAADSGLSISFAQESKKKMEAEALDHPLVQETLRVFGGRVAEIQEES
jgi:hypothetical protein